MSKPTEPWMRDAAEAILSYREQWPGTTSPKDVAAIIAEHAARHAGEGRGPQRVSDDDLKSMLGLRHVGGEKWPERFFAQIVDGFLRESGNRGGPVGRASSHLIPARELLAYAIPIMERIARG